MLDIGLGTVAESSIAVMKEVTTEVVLGWPNIVELNSKGRIAVAS